jgi:hypothetical protein
MTTRNKTLSLKGPARSGQNERNFHLKAITGKAGFTAITRKGRGLRDIVDIESESQVVPDTTKYWDLLGTMLTHE